MRSSSFVMALLFTLLLGLSSGVLGYFTFYFNRGHYMVAEEGVVDTELRYLTAATRRGELQPALALAEKAPGRIFLLQDAAGHVLDGSLPRVPRDALTLKPGTLLFHYNGALYGAKFAALPGGGRLLAGIDVSEPAAGYRIMQYLSVASIVLMLAVVLISFVISTFVVSRTNRIAQAARGIMETGDLSRRIEIAGSWDDLSNTASVLNALLARIEQLLLGIRQVSDNIAHDLRTPLTRLLNNLERLQKTLPPDAGAQTLCDAMIGEAGRLLDTFNALLRIARIETEQQRRNFADVDLRQIVQDVGELYEPLAEEKQVVLAIDAATVPARRGDRDLLFQCIANLLDNAIKFTPAGGRVMLMLTMADGAVFISIRDTGPGIADTDKAKVFDRFYRAESSRTTAGNGLGLSLVAAVVALHGGSIELGDADPGLIVQLRF